MTRQILTTVFCLSLLAGFGCGEALDEPESEQEGLQAGQQPPDGDSAGESTGDRTDRSDGADDAASGEPTTNTDYHAQVIELVNAKRAAGATCGQLGEFPAQPPLHHQPVLEELAMELSLAQATAGDVFHSSSLGASSYQRGVESGYRGEVWGENVSGGDPSPQSVVDGWMSSPSHCSVIMMADVDDVGVGYAFRADAPHGHYWTLTVGQSAELCPIASPWRDDCPS